MTVLGRAPDLMQLMDVPLPCSGLKPAPGAASACLGNRGQPGEASDQHRRDGTPCRRDGLHAAPAPERVRRPRALVLVASLAVTTKANAAVLNGCIATCARGPDQEELSVSFRLLIS
jgi:hypothetical protein